MGVVSTNTMVAGTTGSGLVGFFINQAGSMSPTTTDAFGVSPTISYVFSGFSFVTIQFVGHLDNSSITGMTVTPAGGSPTTFTFTSYVWDSNNNVTRFSEYVGTYPAFVSGTTYTVELLCTTTDMNTEGTTLERRNPKDMNDFYGATRNVPPVSGAFKLSWLKNAVKYDHGHHDFCSIHSRAGRICCRNIYRLFITNTASFRFVWKPRVNDVYHR